MRSEITIPVHLDEDTFKRYCHFDTMVMRRRWLAPVLAGMIAFTLALAALLSQRPELATPAGVLAGLGIAIPAMFFGLYFLQVRAQAAERGLKDAPAVYTVALREDDVRVANDQKPEAPVTLTWPGMAAAYRVKDCIYLYANAQHAFLLPAGQADASQDEVWAYLLNHLGADKCFNRLG